MSEEMDPRLNSVHLPAPRRQQFRDARKQLLGTRGEQTLQAERLGSWSSDLSCTLAASSRPAVPPTAVCWLVEHNQVHPLKVGVNTLGRSTENDVVLQDDFISRRHCAIVMHHDSSCEVHDIASKNGTFLNGEKLTSPARLRPGDCITISDQSLVFMARIGSSETILD
jgi:hypothetical protein